MIKETFYTILNKGKLENNLSNSSLNAKIEFRCNRKLKKEVEQKARELGLTLSELSRSVLHTFLCPDDQEKAIK